jgi:hypothetical protein
MRSPVPIAQGQYKVLRTLHSNHCVSSTNLCTTGTYLCTIYCIHLTQSADNFKASNGTNKVNLLIADE